MNIQELWDGSVVSGWGDMAFEPKHENTHPTGERIRRGPTCVPILFYIPYLGTLHLTGCIRSVWETALGGGQNASR